MREIIFRGKRDDGNGWIIGNLVVWDDKSTSIDISGDEGAPFYAVDTDTVGQYTGLIDKDGTPIYEGDIVEGLHRWGMTFPAVCVFDEGAFGLEWYHNGTRRFQAFACFYNVEFTVIGNIYDNPELLKEATK